MDNSDGTRKNDQKFSVRKKMQSFQKLLLDIERYRQKALPPQTPNIKGAKSHYRVPRRKETLIDLSNILPNFKQSLGQKAHIYYKSLKLLMQKRKAVLTESKIQYKDKSPAKTTDDNVEENILGEISPSVGCQGKSSQRSSIKTLSKANNKASNNRSEINAPDEQEPSDSEGTNSMRLHWYAGMLSLERRYLYNKFEKKKSSSFLNKFLNVRHNSVGCAYIACAAVSIFAER
uniref:Uncharacterized protein n=1 Tax=Glossina austeni TaxID=7395 RepID=A0A1A9VEY7_GLOAU